MTGKRRGKGPRAPSAAQRPLLKALLGDREERALWSVVGDLLQTEGDPRVALVSLMLEREARPSPRLLDAERGHRAQHLARLAPELDGGSRGGRVAARLSEPAPRELERDLAARRPAIPRCSSSTRLRSSSRPPSGPTGLQ